MAKLSDLVTDCTTGNYSHTKIWTNIAYCSATIAFLVCSFHPDKQIGVEIWFAYLGIVGGHNLGSKYLSMKYGTKNDT